MPALRVDGREVTVPDGGTVLEAARLLGIPIPTLCHLEGLEPSSSCLMCIVRVNGSDQLLPSCAVRAEEGMEIESETPEVKQARKMALELLLADHLGECLAPCTRICPLDLDIPKMTKQVEDGDLAAAVADVRLALPFPGVLGRVCAAKCEVGCRRTDADGPVAIKSIERQVADHDREGGGPTLPPCGPDSGKRVAVVGGGPAGLSAAYFLRLPGHAVTVFEQRERIGGRLRHAYGEELPEEVLDAELSILKLLGVEIRCGEEADAEALRGEYDAVVAAAEPAVRRIDDPARAMAWGRDAAAAADAQLAGREPVGKTRPFTTVVGKLTAPELSLYLETAAARAQTDDLAGQGGRCLLCACSAVDTCLLMRYGEELGADPRRFRVKRRIYTRNLDHPNVIYEPGKCIACGICVAVTEEMGEELGLTFIGRGFDVRVGVPFDAPLRDALRQAAERAVTHCPTGALEFKERDQGASSD